MTTNEMIYEALTTDSRKRKARFQTELEALGYKIIKDGSWYISNPKTRKWIDLPYDEASRLRTSNGAIRFGYVYSRSCKTRKYKPLTSINFVGILNSTRNTEYESNQTNVNIMTTSLYNRKYHQEALDNSMSEYQKTIDDITKEYQKKLADAKRHYDWSIEHHTKALETSNNTINKLLKRA